MEHLPKIYGVVHVDKYLEDAKKIIDKLPEKSIVGLESIQPMILSPMLRKKYPLITENAQKYSSNFFSALAEYAEKNGHTVKWLDRPLFSMAGIHDDLKKVEGQLRDGNQEAFASFFDYSTGRLSVFLSKYSWRLNTARSKIFVHQLRMQNRLKNPEPRKWKKTDVVFMGSLHAAQSAKLLNTRIKKYLGVSTRNWLDRKDLIRATQALKEYETARLKRQQERRERLPHFPEQKAA